MENSNAEKITHWGKVRTEGWEVVNAIPASYVDHVCNATDLSQFPDNTFTELYASHIVEHLDYVNELAATLQGWHRVLTPGGKIYISVPDLDTLAKLFLDKDNLSLNERFHVMHMIFGGHVNRYDYHVAGLNEDFLKEFLSKAGYSNITRVENFSIFEDASKMKFKDVAISVNMLAEKP